MAKPTSSNDPAGFGFIQKKHDNTYPFIDPVKGEPAPLKILITGASKGIGRKTAASFAKAGASDIALLARSNLDEVATEVVEAAKKAGRKEPKVLKLQVSTTDAAAVEGAMKTVEREFQYLDVVINNASRMETWRPFHETDVDDWWSTWEVNLKGTFLISRAALPLLMKSNHKTTVMITSAGALSTRNGGSAYQGTKTAQIRLTDHIMKEYGDQGLIAYSVHPGGVKTEVALAMPEDTRHLLTSEPELPADTLVWLTRERRDWLAGRYVNAPWDMQEFLAKQDEIVEKDLLKLRLTV